MYVFVCPNRNCQAEFEAAREEAERTIWDYYSRLVLRCPFCKCECESKL